MSNSVPSLKKISRPTYANDNVSVYSSECMQGAAFWSCLNAIAQAVGATAMIPTLGLVGAIIASVGWHYALIQCCP